MAGPQPMSREPAGLPARGTIHYSCHLAHAVVRLYVLQVLLGRKVPACHACRRVAHATPIGWFPQVKHRTVDPSSKCASSPHVYAKIPRRPLQRLLVAGEPRRTFRAWLPSRHRCRWCPRAEETERPDGSPDL